MIKIAETVLGADAANIDFTSIPATYSHLLLIVQARSTEAVVDDYVRLRFNNDSGANYDDRNAYSVGSGGGSQTGEGDQGATSAIFGWISGASAPSGAADAFVLLIPSYARTTFQKVATVRGTIKDANTSGSVYETRASVFWRSTAAINQITLFPHTGNFKAGTVATLYGLP